MSDDAERRLRDALHDVALPPAPESLRASMRSMVATAPAPARSRPRWLRALPALAAVVAVAVVVGATTGGFGRLGTPESSASTSSGQPSATPGPATQPSPTRPPEPPAPPTSVHVLTAVELYGELFAAQAGRGVAHDVVANVGATPMEAGVSACAEPVGTCTIVGILNDFGPAGVISVREEDSVLPPPVTTEDLKAPLALRIVPGGPTELLGHVDLASGPGAVDVEGLRARTTTTPAGHVAAALAWLQGSELLTLCPAQAPVVEPFICPGNGAFLTAGPSAGMPASGLHVGGADRYRSFAPSALVSGAVAVPRQGLYLVRMVAVDTAACRACRGWLLVGRLDATDAAPTSPTSTPTATPGDGARVYSAAELEAALTADRAALVGHAVLVDGPIDSSLVPTCALGSKACPIGRLAGTTEMVVATRYTSSLFPPGASYSTHTVMALLVRDTWLDYLGWMATGSDGTFTATLDTLRATAAGPPLGPATFIVTAWLGTTGPLPCPAAPGPPPPDDTPFGSGCPSSWLAPSEQQSGLAMPEGGVRVQFGAYADFAAPRGSTVGPPRLGTYLVRLITDTRQGTNGPRGWQVVARLSP